ncbi:MULTISPECIES: hypothetical protein [unclassified Brevibacterium]|uniref:hypothetical protein n=1 Tax=unclassified Brevibacterium TaxID=2614124 RepID=UPI001F10F469|nr:hypothetical protein [Brevibacterium sp. S22]
MTPVASSARSGTNENSAYRRAITVDSREIAQRLNDALGGTLVSALAGAADAKSSHKWAKAHGPQPRQDSVTRLIFAYEQWQRVSEAEGEDVARMWFIGANPWLQYDTPVNAIRNGHFRQVADAATALVDDSFNG